MSRDPKLHKFSKENEAWHRFIISVHGYFLADEDAEEEIEFGKFEYFEYRSILL